MSLTGKDLVTLFKKQPVGITCGLVSLGLLATLYLRADAQGEAEKLFGEKEAEAKRLKGNNDFAKSLEKDTADLAAANKEARDRAVLPRNLSLNLQYFYKMEEAAQVKDLNTTQLGPVLPTGKNPPKTTYLPVAYKVSVQGDFAQVTDLLRRLEQGSRFARVSDAKLSPSAREGPEALKLSLVLSLELLGLPSAP